MDINTALVAEPNTLLINQCLLTEKKFDQAQDKDLFPLIGTMGKNIQLAVLGYEQDYVRSFLALHYKDKMNYANYTLDEDFEIYGNDFYKYPNFFLLQDDFTFEKSEWVGEKESHSFYCNPLFMQIKIINFNDEEIENISKYLINVGAFLINIIGLLEETNSVELDEQKLIITIDHSIIKEHFKVEKSK